MRDNRGGQASFRRQHLSAALLGTDSAMDEIPLFTPAGAQAWLA
jgi:hypothetical protein